MTESNRKERRKANALARKPLGRLGVPMHTGVVQVVLDAPEGPQTQFYWWASENADLLQEIAQNLERSVRHRDLHGPFDTAAAADEAARLTVLGPDCEVTEGGAWDPAWEKLQ
jgi:hypothetical protein